MTGQGLGKIGAPAHLRLNVLSATISLFSDHKPIRGFQ
jgi:hypothetical protein